MGRKKIKITRISDERNRQVTFTKRKMGLMKKAYELSVLCDCEIGIIICSNNNKLYQYTSSDMDSILLKYTEFSKNIDSYTNKDIIELLHENGSKLEDDNDYGKSLGLSSSADCQDQEIDDEHEKVNAQGFRMQLPAQSQPIPVSVPVKNYAFAAVQNIPETAAAAAANSLATDHKAQSSSDLHQGISQDKTGLHSDGGGEGRIVTSKGGNTSIIAQNYSVSANLAKRVSDILLSRLKQFGQRHPDHTRALIKEKLTHNADSDVATTSLRVSLVCPLGKRRIQIPCRTNTCSHLQPFDAFTFFMMNEKKPTWMCPVCDRPATYDKLIIDGFFLEICQQETEANEIQFTDDGSWSPVRQSKESHLISSPSRSSSSAAADKKSNVEVTDLTLSSDEEEDEVPSANQADSKSLCGKIGWKETEASKIQFIDDRIWRPVQLSSSQSSSGAKDNNCLVSPNKMPKLEVTDLTISSDEDEAPISI
ncbi:hypothetical protein ACJMK2_044378 [Sinanodonta woodiana]|uniref:Uncharacterized protein n=1 Tax=Sinanodonta woodiana TaxID=1069815 RepID=A0ABD3VZW5_SINWO